MRRGSTWVGALLLSCIFCARADALQDAQTAVARKDYAQALRLLEPLARKGDAQAQLQLGLLHYHGRGVPESDAKAFAWFEKAAKHGSAEGQYQLGHMYAYGLVRPSAKHIDPGRLAAQWYFEAARRGHAEAQYSLGILFLTGTGVVQDRKEARRWIESAAKLGHADARAYLADAPP